MNYDFDVKGAKKAMKSIDNLIDFYDRTWGGGNLEIRNKLIKELIPLKNDLFMKIQENEKRD